LHGPRTDDDSRHLSGDGGNRGQSGRGPERRLKQREPAVEQSAGERHGIFFALDRHDRDHDHTTEQVVHAYLPGCGTILN
jgi:hypothetical protein